jgi:hypothetical protein
MCHLWRGVYLAAQKNSASPRRTALAPALLTLRITRGCAALLWRSGVSGRSANFARDGPGRKAALRAPERRERMENWRETKEGDDDEG